MKTQTEMAVRGVLAMDDEIKPENIERALDVLRGSRSITRNSAMTLK